MADLVKKIKYDGNIEKADTFNNELGQKLDTLIQTATEVKSEIDNNVVQLFQGNDLQGSEANMDNELGDFEDDFGSDDMEEFSMDDSEGDEDLDLDGIDFGEVSREKK